MKNGEAEWPNDGSPGCDRSRGKVTVLCLQRAGSGFNLAGKLFCKASICPHKGHLPEHARGGFSKWSKGNVVPLPPSLNLL